MITPELSRRFARFMNSKLVMALPVEEKLWIRDVLIKAQSVDDLPPDIRNYFNRAEHE